MRKPINLSITKEIIENVDKMKSEKIVIITTTTSPIPNLEDKKRKLK